MIRGLVPQEHLLEWAPQDGYKPLCEFLDMEVIDEPFPHINTKDKGWKDREAQITKKLVAPALRKAAIFFALLAAGVDLHIGTASSLNMQTGKEGSWKIFSANKDDRGNKRAEKLLMHSSFD